MIESADFVQAIERFPWESEAQRKGYLALVQYLRKFGIKPQIPVDYLAAFLIQKSHESHEWHVNLMARQIDLLKRELVQLQEKIDGLSSLEAQSTTIPIRRDLFGSVRRDGE